MKFGRSSILILTFCFLTLPVTVRAGLDITFGSAGIVTTNIHTDDRPIGSFILPNGKILIVAESFQTVIRYSFLRYNSDGTPDMTYGTGGRVQLSGLFLNEGVVGRHGVNAAYRQSDGKIVLVGDDEADGLVARLNEDGTFDNTFASGGITRPNITQGDNRNDVIYSAVITSDGKITVAGTTDLQTSMRVFLLRYHSNGLPDQSFGGEGFIVHPFFMTPAWIFVQPSGKIVASSANSRSPGSTGTIRRFNTDGSIDAAFTPIVFGPALTSSAIQPDGKILAGEAISVNDHLERLNTDIRISRYTVDGAVDGSFGDNGKKVFDLSTSHCNDSPNAIVVADNGDIIVSVITIVQANRSLLRGPVISLASLSNDGTVTGRYVETNSSFFGDAILTLYPDGRILTAFRTQGPNVDILLTRVIDIPLQGYGWRGVPFDLAVTTADAIADVAIFRPSDRRWWAYPNGVGFPPFGLATDIPVVSDYIADTGSEVAVFRPSNGTWYISRNIYAPGDFITVPWGANGDIPVPADYDGDRKSDVAVFRPSEGVWHIRKSSDGKYRAIQWGMSGDKPVIGDYDGDAIDDVAVYRPSDGFWYILRSSDWQPMIGPFGANGDIPVQADYDGDGKTDLAVWRPSNGVWYRIESRDGNAVSFAWGESTDIPVPADYNGDIKADVAVLRPSQGKWYVYKSGLNTIDIYTWGTATDLPIAARY